MRNVRLFWRITLLDIALGASGVFVTVGLIRIGTQLVRQSQTNWLLVVLMTLIGVGVGLISFFVIPKPKSPIVAWIFLCSLFGLAWWSSSSLIVNLSQFVCLFVVFLSYVRWRILQERL